MPPAGHGRQLAPPASCVLLMLLPLANDAAFFAASDKDERSGGGSRGGSASASAGPARAARKHRRGPVQSRRGVVASTQGRATDIGVKVLERGGNAFDAAAAVQFALAVLEPQFTGLGAGTAYLLRDGTTGKVAHLDGREEAPERYHEAVFCKGGACGRPARGAKKDGSMRPPKHCTCEKGIDADEDERCRGGVAVGVPGLVATVSRMLREKGSLRLAELLRPAVLLARRGFPMYQDLYKMLEEKVPLLSRWSAGRKVFLRPDPKNCSRFVPKAEVGQPFRNPDLARTLLSLGRPGGVRAFHRGAIGRQIVAAARSAKNRYQKRGLLQAKDLKEYRAVMRPVVKTSLKPGGAWGNQELRVYGTAPPMSGGGTIALMLNLLEARGLNLTNLPGERYYGASLDAQNVAFADRGNYIADADFTDVPLAPLSSKSYAKARAEKLFKSDGSAVPIPIEPGKIKETQTDTVGGSSHPDRGTSFFVIADSDGSVVAATSSVNYYFGSGVVVPGRGFLLNDELCDFDPLPRDREGRLRKNAPDGGRRPRRTAMGTDADTRGGKRPRSSMAPTIVTRVGKDGREKIAAVVGSPGGSAIIGTVFGVLVDFIYRGLDLKKAVQAPRALGRNCEFTPTTGTRDEESENAKACANVVEDGIGSNRRLAKGLRSLGFRFSVPPPRPYPQHDFGEVQMVTFGGDTPERLANAEGITPVFAAADTWRIQTAKAGAVREKPMTLQ